MTEIAQAAHNESVIQQFTKQAVPFTNLPGHSNEEALKLLLKLTKVSPIDIVLDIACGPGIVACAFAEVAQQVTGIDLTPAMIERAQLLQQEKKLSNLNWQISDVLPLPYDDASFSLVITRYSFHHFINPQAVLAEMKRVCTPGGRVLVVDVTPAPDKVVAYNHLEKLRDPSHIKALTLTELLKMFQQAGLTLLKTDFYKLEMELEKQLQASFPNLGDADIIRQLFVEDLKTDSLGVESHCRENEIHFAYPIAVIVGQKAVSGRSLGTEAQLRKKN